METTEERSSVAEAKIEGVGGILAAKMDGLSKVVEARDKVFEAKLAEDQRTSERLERTATETATQVNDILQKMSTEREHSTNVDTLIRTHHGDIKALYTRTEDVNDLRKQSSDSAGRIKRLEKRRILQDVLIPLGFFLSTVMALVEAAKLFGLI